MDSGLHPRLQKHFKRCRACCSETRQGCGCRPAVRYRGCSTGRIANCQLPSPSCRNCSRLGRIILDSTGRQPSGNTAASSVSPRTVARRPSRGWSGVLVGRVSESGATIGMFEPICSRPLPAPTPMRLPGPQPSPRYWRSPPLLYQSTVVTNSRCSHPIGFGLRLSELSSIILIVVTNSSIQRGSYENIRLLK